VKRFAIHRCGGKHDHAEVLGVVLTRGQIHSADGFCWVNGCTIGFGFWFFCVRIVLWGKEIE